MSTWFKYLKNAGRMTPQPQGVVYSLSVPQPRQLLFLFPLLEDHFKQSIYVLRRLERHPGGAAILLAIPMLFRGLIPTPSHQRFYFPFLGDRLSNVQLDVLMARFRHAKFDAVINLDPNLDLKMSKVLSLIQAPKRIGFVNQGADEIFNIQIRAQPSSPLRAGYDQMLDLCDLGPPGDHPDYHTWG